MVKHVFMMISKLKIYSTKIVLMALDTVLTEGNRRYNI